MLAACDGLATLSLALGTAVQPPLLAQRTSLARAVFLVRPEPRPSLSRDHLTTALAYVDLNPVRAGLVGDAMVYPWSSAVAHADGRDGRGLLDLDLWRQVPGHERWADVFGRPLGEENCRAVRAATRSGLPLGNESFVSDLERRLGRQLRAGKPGRKAQAAAAGPY